MPECFIDTTLVESLLDAHVSHKHSCNEVARAMEKGKFKDEFAIGIIDNDKRKLPYVEGFAIIGQTANMSFLKHDNKPQYIIKVGKPHEAMETFLLYNVDVLGMKMEDFDLPSDIDELCKLTKKYITTKCDPRIQKLCKTLRNAVEVSKLQSVLNYLVEKKYEADIEVLKYLIGA